MRPLDPGSVPETPFGKRLVASSEKLTKLHKRIEKVLTDLDQTPASSKEISQQAITRDVYGSGQEFKSSDALANLYEKIHTDLTTMWKTFGDQVEAFGLMALVCDDRYGGIDAEQARRLHEIQTQTREHYRDPETAKQHNRGGHGGGHGSDQASGDAT